jgi:viroplasmin and RNaseH domain-containing protein
VFDRKVLGVYQSWEECSEQVTGYEYNLHKGYKTKEAALKAYSRVLGSRECEL